MISRFRQIFVQAREKLSSRQAESPEIDLCFMISEYNRGWVLETICKEIERYWKGSTAWAWTRKNSSFTAKVPSARRYWFSHFQLLITCLKQFPWMRERDLMVWYTHPSKEEIPMQMVVDALNACKAVIFTCSINRDYMVSLGVRQEISHVVLGGADPLQYRARERGKGKVGFCSAYYPRKSPDLMLELIKAMPHREFLLLAPLSDGMETKERLWQSYERFDELQSLPNLEYVEAEYSEYADFYQRMDEFVMLSQLEGGPIPLLEAMMCNAVPVSNRTGFAPDLIEHGHNGFLFDIADGLDAVVAHIEAASAFEGSIRESVELYSWERLSLQIQQIIDGQMDATARDRQASGLMSCNSNKAALAVLSEAIRHFPANAHLWRRKGDVWMRLNNPEQALVAFKQALELDKKPERLWPRLARANLDVGDFRAALEAYVHTEAHEPIHAFDCLVAWHCALAIEDDRAGFVWLERALERAGTPLFECLNAARYGTSALAGRLLERVRILEQLNRLPADRVAGARILLATFFLINRAESFARELTEGLERLPADQVGKEGLLIKAQVDWRTGQLYDALKALRVADRCFALELRELELYYKILVKVEFWEEAIRCLDRIAADKEQATVEDFIEKALRLAKLARHGDVIELLEPALRDLGVLPRKTHVFLLAQAYTRQGELKEAMQLMDEYPNLLEDNRGARLYYEGLVRLGRLDAADAWLSTSCLGQTMSTMECAQWSYALLSRAGHRDEAIAALNRSLHATKEALSHAD
ncbi:MAG: glycosyltransferase [Opitutales bacterium]|nr:glycosyltransferase [Opitutales bacterium]